MTVFYHLGTTHVVFLVCAVMVAWLSELRERYLKRLSQAHMNLESQLYLAEAALRDDLESFRASGDRIGEERARMACEQIRACLDHSGTQTLNGI